LLSGLSGGGDLPNQRAILVWENGSRIHGRGCGKKVTFAFVASLRTDEQVKDFNEKTKRKSSKVIKDLPMEGI
jgi:hypothetical protein